MTDRRLEDCDMAQPIRSITDLEDRLSEPSAETVAAMSRLGGDLLILGAGGKMGPTLARLASRAFAVSGSRGRVFAVSTFSTPHLRERLDALGIATIAADLMEPGALDALPDAAHVVYMAGRRFGSAGAEWLTWATNVFLPGLVAQRYQTSRIVAFSSGNIYPFVPVDSGGATESTVPGPVGEYAMTCLGRERVFEYVSQKFGVETVQLRLNYAVELRYGVLVDVAAAVWDRHPLDLAMGYFNCVWQGYANRVALESLALADVPPRVLNLTGPEVVSVRDVATRFGRLMGRAPVFIGAESNTALLNNAGECRRAVRAADTVPQHLLTRAAEITDVNAAVFDAAHQFAGCIPGINEMLVRQGLMAGRWTLESREDLCPGQIEEIDRVCMAYPHLNDDAFVAAHRDAWLR